MTEFINKLEIKKIRLLQKIQQITQRIDIFCSALMFQAWRRTYYAFNKREIYKSIKSRKGDCLRCGRCCHASLKCQHLAYDENGLSMCNVYDQKPRMCSLYPYNGDDYFYHLKPTCGYKYDDE